MGMFSSISSLLFVSRVLGLAPFKVENQIAVKSRNHVYYSSIVLGIGILIVIKELIKKGIFEVDRIREPLWSITVVLKLMTFIICSILMMFIAVFQVSTNTDLLNRMDALLKSLKFGDYENMSVFTHSLVLTNLVMFFMCFCHGFIGFYNANALQMFQALFQYIFLFFINVLTMYFVLFVYMVRMTYCTMNKILIYESKNSFLARRLTEEMIKMKKYDIDVKNLAEKVNSVFMPFLLFYIIWLFMNKIHGFMWITHEEFSWFSLLLYTIYFDGLVVYLLGICSWTYDEAEKTANYLHELFIDNDDPELKEEIEIFSLQLLHRKVEFNACGFFKLDFSLLYSMVGAVTTYIIILMQFQGNNGVHSGNCTAVNCINCTTIS